MLTQAGPRAGHLAEFSMNSAQHLGTKICTHFACDACGHLEAPPFNKEAHVLNLINSSLQIEKHHVIVSVIKLNWR